MSEAFDHAAFRNAAACALVEHTRQLRAQEGELSDALIDRCQMARRDLVNVAAWLVRSRAESQQLTDIFDAKSQVAGMPDEVETLYRVVAIPALLAIRAVGHAEQTDLLVVPDGRDFDTRASGKLADGNHAFFSLNL
jgi:hypothetical protein